MVKPRHKTIPPNQDRQSGRSTRGEEGAVGTPLTYYLQTPRGRMGPACYLGRVHRLRKSVKNWPPFADSAGALQYLKRHYRLAILSNVDNERFAASNQILQISSTQSTLLRTLDRTSRPIAISSTCSRSWRHLEFRSTRSCTPRKACFTTTRQRTRTD